MTTDTPTPKVGTVKKIILRTLLAFVAIIVALCVVISLRSNDFRVARTATFKATPAAVFEQVNDFHKWDAWSPWVKLDPNAKSTFEGPTSGEGAKMSWVGNSNIGEGNMTIVESKPNDVVRIRLEFIKPMAGVNDVEMKVEPKGDETQLTWTMAGKNGFMGKAIGLFMDCEKMCGDQFEIGLSNMRKIVEARPAETTPEKPSDT
jgi:hypothetical protein